MANEKNLVPNSARTPSERKINAQKAGKASGRARREKKAIQEMLNEFLLKPISKNKKLSECAEKIGVDSKKSIKELFTVACVLNTLADGTLSDLEKLINLTGEQTGKDASIIAKLDSVLKGIDDIAEQGPTTDK